MTLLKPAGTAAPISAPETDSSIHLTHFLLNQSSLVTFTSLLLITF